MSQAEPLKDPPPTRQGAFGNGNDTPTRYAHQILPEGYPRGELPGYQAIARAEVEARLYRELYRPIPLWRWWT